LTIFNYWKREEGRGKREEGRGKIRLKIINRRPRTVGRQPGEGGNIINVFVKPKEQSDACIGYALARKRT
jgi:hypothetical protein